MSPRRGRAVDLLAPRAPERLRRVTKRAAQEIELGADLPGWSFRPDDAE